MESLTTSGSLTPGKALLKELQLLVACLKLNHVMEAIQSKAVQVHTVPSHMFSHVGLIVQMIREQNPTKLNVDHVNKLTNCNMCLLEVDFTHVECPPQKQQVDQ